jgi:ABC-type bacteriocin/lantibiotic exporter with double-glycine peptidase domain
MTLVVLATIPVIGIAGFIQMKALTGFGAKTREAYASAGQTAVEAVENVRTIMVLSKEAYFFSEYRKKTETPHAIAVRGAFISSFGYAFSQGSFNWCYALAFYYGSRLLVWQLYSSKDVLVVMFSVIFSSMAMGQSKGRAGVCVSAILCRNVADSPSSLGHR